MEQITDCSASLFDLNQTRQFLNFLCPKPGTTAKESPFKATEPGYSKLSGVAGLSSSPSSSAAGTTFEEEGPAQPLTSWEDFLAWCTPLTRAEASFVVDSQGFIIANRGRIPAEGFDGAGAEMICSVEQLQRIAPDAGEIACVDIGFDKRRIVGFVTNSEEIVQYAMVLIAPGSFCEDMKGAIQRQLINSLPSLE